MIYGFENSCSWKKESLIEFIFPNWSDIPNHHLVAAVSNPDWQQSEVIVYTVIVFICLEFNNLQVRFTVHRIQGVMLPWGDLSDAVFLFFCEIIIKVFDEGQVGCAIFVQLSSVISLRFIYSEREVQEPPAFSFRHKSVNQTPKKTNTCALYFSSSPYTNMSNSFPRVPRGPACF